MALHLTGSIGVSDSITSTHFSGSMSGSFQGDGSGLTNISADPFPYTGSAIISGSQEVSGSAGFSYPVTSPTAWSAGGALITARYGLAGAGTQNAGLAAGGYAEGWMGVSFTEEYDGSSWAAGGALSTARYDLAGAGTQNAALAFGGYDNSFNIVTCTEEYDGSSWSSGGNLITARCGLAGAGTQNAGLAIGGSTPFRLTCTEEYDGSSWAAGGALSTANYLLAGAGTQNAGLAFGGVTGPVVACTEEYDGTSWTAGGALITARFELGGAGTQNAGLAFGGRDFTTVFSTTEEYDGTSWSAGSALITGRRFLGGAGTQNAALAFGGRAPSVTSATEEYTGASTNFTKTFDYSSTTGEITATGSFTGSFTGDGSGLTNISADPFPYTGSAIISGSQEVSGDLTISSGNELTDPGGVNVLVVGNNGGQAATGNGEIHILGSAANGVASDIQGIIKGALNTQAGGAPALELTTNNALEGLQILPDSFNMGIQFPKTTSTVAGKAATSKILIDYEEGTWTPTSTLALQDALGYYTKIGRQVTLNFRIRPSATVAGSGVDATFGGVPFAIDNTNGAQGRGVVRYHGDAEAYIMQSNGTTQLQTSNTWGGINTITGQTEPVLTGTFTYFTTE